MAERRGRRRPADEPEGETTPTPADEGGRRRRSEMSRRELRQRTKRASRAAREGDPKTEHRRGRDDDASPDEQREIAPRDEDAPAAAGPQDGRDEDREVPPLDEDAPAAAGRQGGEDDHDIARDPVVPAPSRRRRRRGKHRDRTEVAGIDAPTDAEGRDRTSGEVLFADPEGPRRDADASVDADGEESAADDDVEADGEEAAADGRTEAASEEEPADAAADADDVGEDDGGGDVEGDREEPGDEGAGGEGADDEGAEEQGEDRASPDAESHAGGDEVEPPVVAPRTPARQKGSRRASRLVAGLLLLVVVVIFGLVAMQLGWIDIARDMVGPATEEEPHAEPPADGWQPAILLASVDDQVPGGQLRSLAVLASDRRENRGTVLLIPTTVVADVPGFGSFTLREAWELGGSSLVAVTVDNLLGLHVDGVLALDGAGWTSWFAPADGIELTVGSRIVPREGHDREPVEPGARAATPEEAASYALIHGQGETELDVLPRTRQVLDALFAAIAEDPSVLDEVVDAARTFPGTATPDRVRTVLGELAEHREQDAVTSVTLPVVPLGSGDEDLYRSDEERLGSVIDERFAASRDDRTVADRLALQILNGNGRPGVGQDVAERLADGSYRIVLTGNADRFTYDTTRIVVYSEDADVLRAAQDIQERLGGIGSIERAGTPQSVVDVTIVVGHDFPP